MNFKKGAAACLVALGFGTVFNTAFAGDQAPPYVQIKKVIPGGQGCQRGTTSSIIAPDRKSFTLIFDEFFVEDGPDLTSSDSHKECNVAVVIDFPQGWSYSVASFDYRGYAYLPGKKSRAIFNPSYYFSTSDAPDAKASEPTKLKGPLDDNFLISDTFGIDAVVWSPCGATKPLVINDDIKVVSNYDNKYAMLQVDSIDGKIEQKYHLSWKKCHSSDPDPGSSGDSDSIPVGDLPGLKIRDMVVGGSGCPAGTVHSIIAPDRTSLTLIYDKFMAQTGRDPETGLRTMPSEARKFCQVGLEFDYPKGWSFALMSLDTRGYVDLDPRMEATLKTEVYEQASTREPTFEPIVFKTGKNDILSDSYRESSKLLLDALWSPCDGSPKPLNIKTEIKVGLGEGNRDRNSAGLITVDTLDAGMFQKYSLQWRKCD